jgi:serine/threonine protein kinase
MQVVHPNLCPLYHLSQVGSLLIFFMEYEPNGTLADHIKLSPLSEHEAHRLFVQLFDVVRYCHVYHFLVHHDIKAENVLLDENMNVRLIDFGLSDTVYMKTLRSSAGTPGHLPPEVLAGGEHDERCDVWALGVCLFRMMTGRLPFPPHMTSAGELVEAARQLVFPGNFSPRLRDILQRMLTPVAPHRPTLVQLAAHPWLVPLPMIAQNIAPRPIAFYRVEKFSDFLKFRRATVEIDPAIVARAPAIIEFSEESLAKFLRQGKINPATAVYFVLVNPRYDRPMLQSKLPAFDGQVKMARSASQKSEMARKRILMTPSFKGRNVPLLTLSMGRNRP